MIESINSYLSKFKTIIQIRGTDLYLEKRYSVIKYTDEEFLCTINGNSGDYLTRFKLKEGKVVSASCTCPYFDDGYGSPCKHLFAAGLVLRDLLKLKIKKEDGTTNSTEKITPENFKKTVMISRAIFSDYIHKLIQNDDKAGILLAYQKTDHSAYMEYLLEILYDSNLNDWFFSTIDSSFPKNTIKSILHFCTINHPSLSEKLSRDFIRAAFSVDKETDYQLLLLPIAIAAKDKELIKLYLEKELSLSYDAEKQIFRFLKENESPENYTSYFKGRIERGHLYRAELCFLYPYMTEEELSTYKKNCSANSYDSYSYYSRSDTENSCEDYTYKKYASKFTLNLLEKKAPESTISSLDYSSICHLRNTIFKNYGREAVKRFRCIVNAKIRKTYPVNSEWEYIIDTFYDCMDEDVTFRSLFEKLCEEYFSHLETNQTSDVLYEKGIYLTMKKYHISFRFPFKTFEIENKNEVFENVPSK